MKTSEMLLLGLVGGGGLHLGAPTLTAPADDASVSVLTPTFTWNAVNQATSYRIQVIAFGGSFDTPDIDEVVTDPTFTPVADLDVFAGPFTWRVKAIAGGIESEWSAEFAFNFTLAVAVAAALAGSGWWHEYQEVTGTIADNQRYTDAPSTILTETWDSWSADNPTGWTVTGESGSDPEVTQRASGELNGAGDGGTGALNLYSTLTANQPRVTRAATLTIGKTYGGSIVVSAIQSNTYMRVRDQGDGFTTDNSIFNVAGTYTLPDGIAANAVLEIAGRFNPVNATNDSLTIQLKGERDAKLTGTFALTQTGLQGANHAVSLDGSTAVSTIIDTSMNGLTALTLILLVKPAVVGANDRLAFKNGEFDLYLNADGSITAHVDYSTTDAETTSDAGVITASAWSLIEVDFNNTDKTIIIRVNGVIVNNTETQGVGTRVSNANAWLLGKNTSTDGFNGLYDFDLLDSAQWTDEAYEALPRILGLAA